MTDNPFFSSDNPSSLNNIKDMLAGLPQFQEGKEAFSLHLNMASDAMNVFQSGRLADIASVEQVSRSELGLLMKLADESSHSGQGWMKNIKSQKM